MQQLVVFSIHWISMHFVMLFLTSFIHSKPRHSLYFVRFNDSFVKFHDDFVEFHDNFVKISSKLDLSARKTTIMQQVE